MATEAIFQAMRLLWAHKLRSALTLFGPLQNTTDIISKLLGLGSIAWPCGHCCEAKFFQFYWDVRFWCTGSRRHKVGLAHL